MKQLLTFILALLFVTTAFGQRRIAVMVDTNAALINPTNFFVANSNSINNVVVGGGGGGTTYTNLTEGAGSATTFGGPVTVQGTLSVNNETFTDSGANDLRLDSGFNPGTDSTFDLGTPSLYWRTGYLDSVLSPAFVGGGSGLTSLDGTKVTGVLTNNTTGNATTATTAGNITAGATLNAANAAALTNLNATSLLSGTVPLARLSGVTTNELAGYIGTNELSAAAHAIYTGGSDNLGDHTATTNLDMATFYITNAGSMYVGALVGDGSGLTNLTSGGTNFNLLNVTNALTVGTSSGFTVDDSGNIDSVGVITASGNLDLRAGVNQSSYLRSGAATLPVWVLNGGGAAWGKFDDTAEAVTAGVFSANDGNFSGDLTVGGTITGDGSGLTNVYDGHVIRISTSGGRTVYKGLSALSNAVNAHVAGDVLQVFGTNELYAPIILTNATLRGMGNAVLVSWVGAGSGAAIVPYAESKVQNLDIWSAWRFTYSETTNAVRLIGTEDTAGQPSITNAQVFAVNFFGDNDALYVKHTNYCSYEVFQCVIDSAGDPVAQQADGLYQFNLCTFKGGNTASSSFDRIAAVGSGGAQSCTNYFNSCVFELLDSGTAGQQIFYGDTPAPTTFNACIFRSYSTNAAVLLEQNQNHAAAVFYVNGCTFDNFGSASTVLMDTAGAATTHKMSAVFVNNTQYSDLFGGAKGKILVTGGNLDASFTSGSHVYSGITNLWIGGTAAAPSDTATPDAWINADVGGTEYRIPLYTP